MISKSKIAYKNIVMNFNLESTVIIVYLLTMPGILSNRFTDQEIDIPVERNKYKKR